MRVVKIKKWHIWIFVFAILLFGFLFFQDAIANVAWQKFRNADIALALNRADANLAMEIGNYYFNGKGGYDLDKAAKGFEGTVAIDQKILWGHYQLARVYFVHGKYDEALLEINKEFEANPENLRSLYVRGLIRASEGDLSGAEDDFRRFTTWAPKEWAGYNDLAWVLMKEGKYEEAEKTAEKGIEESLGEEKNPWLWNHLGLAELNQKKYKEANESFLKAKEFAGRLTLEEWKNAYPGNNPNDAEEGLREFLRAVDFNLDKSKVK